MEKNYLNLFVPIVRDNEHFIFGVDGQFSGSDEDKLKLSERQISILNKLAEGDAFYSNELEEVFGQKLYEYFVKKSIIITTKQDRNGLFSRTDAFYKINKMGNVRQVLSKKRVMILGCGGIGTHVAWNMATIGVGEIILVDFDRIELSNLNRQLLYSVNDVGLLKTDVLESRLKEINLDIKITCENLMISTKEDLERVYKAYLPDLIVKSLDSPEEFPLFLDEICEKYGVSYVSGSAASTHAIIGPTYIPGKNCGYTKFFLNKDNIAKHISGISPSLSIIMYDMSNEISIEAFKILTRIGEIKYSNLMIFKNVITGDSMEIVPKSLSVESRLKRKKELNKNNFIICLIFLLMSVVTGYSPLIWIGTVYAYLSPVIVFSLRKNALSAAFINVAWYMMISIPVSLVNSNIFFGRTIIQSIIMILIIFIIYSLVLMLTCGITLMLFSAKTKLMRRVSNG